MPNEQVIQLSAINIVLHPHPPGVYERLLRYAFRRRVVAHVYGDRYGIFSQLHRVAQDTADIALEGVISTFSKLDPHLPWFNSETSADASEEDLNALVVPDNLQPNHRQCEFYFDSRSHLFVFNSLTRRGGVSAGLMRKFLEQVFSEPTVMNAVEGRPVLTVVPDARMIDEVIDWPKMKALYIDAHRPNPGDYDAEDLQEFEASLDDQNAKRLEMKLTAQDNEFLDPAPRVQVLAGIAADNGYVEARGVDDAGHSVTKSTRDQKPLVERDNFDPDAETRWDAFRRIAQATVASVRRRRRRGPAR